MKKILMLSLMLLLNIAIYSQTHMDFRGVPIDGPLNSFITKMKGLGYSLVEESGDIVSMKGQFTGQDVELYITASPKTKTVCRVTIYFPERESWDSLERQYKEYKELFIKKYGTNYKSFEYFKKPYYDGDGYELQALWKEKCVYATYFDTPNGIIVVELTKFESLSIGYEDRTNIELRSSEKTSNNLNEI